MSSSTPLDLTGGDEEEEEKREKVDQSSRLRLQLGGLKHTPMRGVEAGIAIPPDFKGFHSEEGIAMLLYMREPGLGEATKMGRDPFDMSGDNVVRSFGRLQGSKAILNCCT